MFTTITGELSLMMLIEAYELAGINVISANTDGVTIMIKKCYIEKMHEINSWWSELTQYELERADYQKIIFSTVNDYLAIKTDGETLGVFPEPPAVVNAVYPPPPPPEPPFLPLTAPLPPPPPPAEVMVSKTEFVPSPP